MFKSLLVNQEGVGLNPTTEKSGHWEDTCTEGAPVIK